MPQPTKRRRSARLANKKRENTQGMYSDDDESEDEEEEEEEHYKPGDIVFAWYYVDKDKQDACPWWPAKIEENNELRFFWQLNIYVYLSLYIYIISAFLFF